MSRLSSTAVIALLVGLTTVSMPLAHGQNKEAKEKIKFTDRIDYANRIEMALDQKCDLEFLETPLLEVAEFLSKRFDINVKVNIRSLEDIGVGADTPIIFEVEGISLRSALKLMLTPHDLTYVVRHEIMQITTIDVAAEIITTQVYPVGDLVISKQKSSLVVVSPDGIRSGIDLDFDPLIDLIMGTIAPDSWDEAGGPGTLSEFNKNQKIALVIGQTDEIHRQVAELLDKLRDIPDHNTKQQADQEKPADKSTSYFRVYPIADKAKAKQEEIAKLVQRVVLPDSWGGKGGAEVLGIAKTIVVKHHAQGQKKVYDFLSELGVLIVPRSAGMM